MPRYNTGNALGSTDFRDGVDNLDALDDVVNSAEETTLDRFGNSIRTLAGLAALAGGITAIEASLEAQAARDAAVVNATLYPDEATGRAAVADGAYFKVAGSGDIAAYLYKRINSSTSTLISSYPSANSIERLTNSILSVTGDNYNFAVSLSSGYIAKSTGVFTTNSSWKATGYIPVLAKSIVRRIGLVVAGSSSACAIAFYSSNLTFLGYYNNSTEDSSIVVSDLFPTAKYIRVTFSNASTNKNLYVTSQIAFSAIEGIDDFSAKVNTAIESVSYDAFESSQISDGYINQSGIFVDNESWITTDFVPYNASSSYVMSGYGNSVLVASVSAWDSNKEFLGVVFSRTGDFADVEISTAISGAAYLRASSSESHAASFDVHTFELSDIVTSVINSRLAALESITGGSISALSPTVAYAKVGEPLYLFSRGVCADRSIDLAWDVAESSESACRITPDSTDAIPVQLRAFLPDATTEVIADFDVLVTGTPVSPSSPRNIICIGDSLTYGVNATIQGAWPNELGRRLTGTGTALLSGAQSPAALTLSNIHIRGTRGDQPVKHEGRSGWRASDYLNKASVSGVSNAFWNPSSSQFDLDYYLTTNGFDSGSAPSGVVSDGSNLTVCILLGWNDVYNSTVEQSTADMSALINKIKAVKPACDVIVIGLNTAPRLNIKDFDGQRFVSEREVFESAIKAFGKSYKEMCAEKTNVDFLQISHVFNPEISYPTTTIPISFRSASTVVGASDHVHPNNTGYAQIADAVFYKILYDYCR